MWPNEINVWVKVMEVVRSRAKTKTKGPGSKFFFVSLVSKKKKKKKAYNLHKAQPLEMLPVFLFVLGFLGHATQLMVCQFPNEELNPGPWQ